MPVTLHRANDRQRTIEPGRVTSHSLSFGAHYDSANVSFAGLLAHNDDLLAPGGGYQEHPHSDVEIVTWVVSGVLRHRDSQGGQCDLTPGTVQVQSAGSGIRHSEVADLASGPTRFVQAWVRPDEADTVPRRAVAQVGALDGLVPLVSGHRSAVLGLGAATATLWIARLEAGTDLVLPQDRLQHLFVVSGSLRLPGAVEVLATGDALRVTDQPGLHLAASEPAELLAWSFAGGGPHNERR